MCKVLSEFPKLDYLHISLDGRGCFDAQSVAHVLESFILLRNVRCVILDGVPPVYAQYLERKMTGSSPLDHLPKMYEALEFYAGPSIAVRIAFRKHVMRWKRTMLSIQACEGRDHHNGHGTYVKC